MTSLRLYSFIRRMAGGAILLCCLISICLAKPAGRADVNVLIITDEADAVLAILAKKQINQPITDADWQRLFSSEGYVRLKQREASMRAPFEDTDFKKFVLSDELVARTNALQITLEEWKRVNVSGAARRALAYLPKEAHIKAKIYPVIKPQGNSFVFDAESDPAIFLYLNPAISKAKFENKLAHELHHIGHDGSCPTKQTLREIAKLPPGIQTVIGWIGSFGEGFAMLAAAGGRDIHPHAVSTPEERARWDRDMQNFNEDLKQVEKFYLDILQKRLTDKDIENTGGEFYGVQGPWYTVGWKMSVVIEKTFGRARLIECICDQRKLLPTYNSAATIYNRRARKPLALWSSAMIEAMGKPKHPRTQAIATPSTAKIRPLTQR